MGGVILSLLPLVLQQYTIHILILVGIYIILAFGLSLVSGFAGQLSLGQAAFYAVGAYVSALLAVRLGLPFWIAALGATVVSSAMGVVLGLPTLRLSGIYLTVATVGFAEIVRLVLLNWTPVTMGPMGIREIPCPTIAGFSLNTPFRYYYLVLVAAIASFFVASRIVNSRVGRAFISVADKEVAAQAIGINPTYYKTLAFVLSAAFAGFAGSLYAHYIAYLHPDAFTQAESIMAVTIIAVGGVRSLSGIVVAGTVLVAAMEYLRAFSEFRLIMYALLLIISLIFMPDGIGGIARQLAAASRKSRKLAVGK
jgi:branched-chain amino acid transport system permease protein